MGTSCPLKVIFNIAGWASIETNIFVNAGSLHTVNIWPKLQIGRGIARIGCGGTLIEISIYLSSQVPERSQFDL